MQVVSYQLPDMMFNEKEGKSAQTHSRPQNQTGRPANLVPITTASQKRQMIYFLQNQLQDSYCPKRCPRPPIPAQSNITVNIPAQPQNSPIKYQRANSMRYLHSTSPPVPGHHGPTCIGMTIPFADQQPSLISGGEEEEGPCALS